jgi:hypothetical protein
MILCSEQVQAYPQAAHCYEEVLLHSPQSIPLYVRYADVLYTMGGSNLKTARQYYAAALKLSNGEDTRALYGICCTAAALSAQKVWQFVAEIPSELLNDCLPQEQAMLRYMSLSS